MKSFMNVAPAQFLGKDPKDRPLILNDLWAKIYRHLGIDAAKAYLDHSGRPMSILSFGEPIRELL
jgi:hypothetical protein